MLNRSVLCLLIVTLALLASPGLPRPVAAQDFLVVDDDGPPSCAPVLPSNIYTTITQALAAASSGGTIRVCEGDYTEISLYVLDEHLTITGPGATPEDDGVATVHLALLSIQADYVVVQGLDLDSTGGPSGTIDIRGSSVTIEHNEIRNAPTEAVTTGAPGLRYVQVLSNNIHDSNEGVKCHADDCVISGNTVNDTGGGAIEAIEVFGNNGNITSNVVVGSGSIVANGDDLFISTNQILGPGALLLSISGSRVGVTDNTLSDSLDYGIVVEATSTSTDVTIARNTFTRIARPIYLYDSNPSDALTLTATIGGSASEANTFIDSGGSLGDSDQLLLLRDIAMDVNAEYNNWGLCTLAEIEQEIYHQVDDPAVGLVDFDPFIAPSACSAATPTPTPTPAPTSTPTPGGRVLTIPPGSWANFAWSGNSSPQDVADCFGAGNISVMYRLDAVNQTYQRWIGGRPELSDMGQVAQYDTLLALNSSSQQVSCTPPGVMLLGRTMTIPAGKWSNFAWSGNLTLSPQEVADCFAQGNISVMYRLDPTTQTYERWIRGRPELSDMGDIAPFDAILGLNSGSQEGSCDIPIMVT